MAKPRSIFPRLLVTALVMQMVAILAMVYFLIDFATKRNIKATAKRSPVLSGDSSQHNMP